ncbi:hypothetical protein FRC14_001230 [Serendipita sp. 396]|nr:hypothetical protein FRC14_001230 [Serendipita sp. 396]
MTTASRQWQTIRPWVDRVSIQVKELTSVSATFILTSASAGDDEDIDQHLAALQVDSEGAHPSQKSIRSILSRGFTLKVNSSGWNNYFLNVEEDGSEAVIILYGLRPGRQYEVEFIIEQEESPLRKDFVTLDADTGSEPVEDIEEPEEEPIELISSPSDHIPSRDLTPPMTPEPSSPVPRRLTIEEQRHNLQQTKTSILQEHETLLSQLKLARKESQRAENAARGEIEVLKRAADKQSVADQRAKQKVLALQEAVKQTISATADIEDQASTLQGELPLLQTDQQTIEEEHASVQEMLAQKEAEMDQAIRADKKRIADLQSDLSTLSNRVEKLTSKKEKLATETIPDLEKQLADVRREIEEVQQENERLSKATQSDGSIPPVFDFHNSNRRDSVTRSPQAPKRNSGPPLANPLPPNFGPINATAPPFYPTRQPVVMPRGLQQLQQVNPRVPADFRPFEVGIPATADTSTGGMPFSSFSQPINRPSKDSL